MDGLKVSELAARSGVPASTVRFYEQEGLLPAQRSPSGYRLYGTGDVDRLAFIGAAKRLGLPLPTIRRVLAPWQDGQCSDVQRELLPLVEQGIRDAHARARDLTAFADRLERARGRLAVLDRPGPCDASCADLGREEPSADAIVCTLDARDHADRVEHWRDVLASVTDRTAIPGGVRLTFDHDRVRVAELAQLAAAEVRCCSFFDLTLHLGPPVRLDARAPEDALVLVHELFGEPV